MNQFLSRIRHPACAVLVRNLIVVVFFIGSSAGSTVDLAADDMWDTLEGEGRALDIMGLQRIADGLQIYGVEYVEELIEAPNVSGAEPALSRVERKQLYVIRVGHDEGILWRHVYPSLPDVHEIFSADTAHNGYMCIVFGEKTRQQDLLKPVLIQIDAQGKILWARRNLIDSRIATAAGNPSLEQIANLDTLRVSATPGNGCMLAFITRVVTRDTENFYLHLIQHDQDGSERWHHTTETQLFGRMFLISDADAKHYDIVQTNQSRDAAIQAMIQGEPFNPQTSVMGISYSGDVLYSIDSPASLVSVWVNGVANANGENILIVGKTRSAWAVFLNSDGEVVQRFDSLPGEFNAVAATLSGGYVLVRGHSMTFANDKLQPGLTVDINNAVIRRYINQYLTARLPDDIPVEQIVAWKSDEYLLLYKLGSRLLKVKVPAKSHEGQ